MARLLKLVLPLVLIGLLGGCRCCSLTNSYANVIDDASDTHVYFDNWYHPKWDISRAGKPDWCGENCQRSRWYCCCEGAWGRYDDCNLYPPSHPYSYPGYAFAQSVRNTSPTPAVDANTDY